MGRYVAGRLVWLVLVLLGVSVITFGLGALAPGDPAQLSLERTLELPPTAEQIDQRRVELGLDRPLVDQYVSWLGRAVKGDFGQSWVSGRRVSASFRERLPRTALLAVCALTLSLLIALPLGAVAAYWRNSVLDHLCRLGALVGASLPGYLTAYVLILILAVQLSLVPLFGFGSPSNLLLPALTLALGSSATLTRLTRATVLDVLAEGYMQTARAKGVPTTAVLFRHALRNAAIPIVTVLGLSLGGLLNGAFIVEWIFAWPGIGTLAVDAINDKDYPVIQGFVLFTAATYVVVNFVTDVTYVSLDPRTRLGGGRV